MDTDIMEALVELLCPQNPTVQNAPSMCSQFISEQAGFGLMGQLFYFLLFPTIFLIIFIYILSSSVLKGDAGRMKMINFLIAAGVWIFIIINGYYALVLPVAKLWFFALPLLGVLYFFLRHWRGGGGGGGMSKAGVGGVVARSGNWLKEAMVGDRPIEPREMFRQRKLLQDEIEVKDKQIREQEDLLKGAKSEREKAEVMKILANLKSERTVIVMRRKGIKV